MLEKIKWTIYLCYVYVMTFVFRILEIPIDLLLIGIAGFKGLFLGVFTKMVGFLIEGEEREDIIRTGRIATREEFEDRAEFANKLYDKIVGL